MVWSETLRSAALVAAADTAPGIPLSRAARPAHVAVTPTDELADAYSGDTDPPPPVSMSRAAVLPVGTRVGDYILGEVIARGGFGVVYRSHHAGTGKGAAVKVLHPELSLSREAVLRFEREVQSIRRIDHPNVIQILDFGELRGRRPYFAMELLNGVDLETYMRACGRLSPEEVLAILEPICSALTTVHNNSIVHRDFKASNVFLAEQNGKRRVVLLDFGVAKVLDDQGPGITTSHNILGTPACMAPEQITGGRMDERTDIYALGALVYYMLTGELPFLDASLTALLHMHLYARPPSPSNEAPVSPAFDVVVHRAMAKDPAARYPSADEFLAAFRAAVEEARGADTPRTPRVSLHETRVAAVHIEVCVDADALEEPDEALIADMEEVLPIATRLMEPKGFTAAVQTGNTMLLVTHLHGTGLQEQSARRDVVAAALELNHELLRRPGRDARVHVNIVLHAGAVFTTSEKVIGGDLMDLGAWVPERCMPGVVVTEAMLDGLEIDTRPVEGSSSLVEVLVELG
jgi:eukaryotic-like serine/threonine-protein kinase